VGLRVGRRGLAVLVLVCLGLLLVGAAGSLHGEAYPHGGDCRLPPQASNGYVHPIVGVQPTCPDTPSPGGPGVGE
ncbi:MAG TPA: hypothetical protein VNT51_03005, partial [Miltoncostaeaceae bacterium]|nr:hypothetical protein [Miltoncostaeaceae bacterium]